MKIAIITDSHVNPADHESSSVYKVHANANPRLRSVVAKVNALEVDLVVHLGDTVHRIQGQPGREKAVARFHEIVAELKAPMILAPGNHDEGEKSTPWAPGHPVTPESLAIYRSEFGADHFVKHVGDYCFIVLNSQLYGLKDEAEEAQKRMLVEALAGPGIKLVFQHHPFFIESFGEREHYDNLPQEVRDEYVPLMTKAGVEMVFAGHVHNYFYNKLDGTRFFVVPSTTFVRHDFTELFPFVPQDGAHGRNYASKLGFFVLECDGRSTGIRWYRTNGHEDPSTAADEIRASPVSLFSGDRTALGIDLRHDWATPRPIPYTQLQDEFNRKHVRNDYFTAALVETAICRLRLPIQDLEDEKPSRRLRELADLGIQAIVFLYRTPTAAQARLLNEHMALISYVECCAPEETIEEIATEVRSVGLDPSLKIAFSAFGTSTGGSEAMAHYIWTGFDLSRPDLEDYLASVESNGFDAAVVRIERHRFGVDLLNRFSARLSGRSIAGIVYARLASLNGAEVMDDDAANTVYVSSLAVLARLLPNVTIYMDTFADHDRGYYPRTGLVDRAYDLRPAGRAVASLTSLIGDTELEVILLADDRFEFRSADFTYLYLPRPHAMTRSEIQAAIGEPRANGLVELYRLGVSGADDKLVGEEAIMSGWSQYDAPYLVRSRRQ